jgi:uncharacterized protein (DUF433 family)
MATAAKLTHPHIVKEPDYCSGKAALDNTRVRVMNVVFLHKQGKTTAEIQETYPDLLPAQVYAALLYYYDNPEEIEAELRADETAAERYEQERAGAMARRSAR